jgi:hypothetical protein
MAEHDHDVAAARQLVSQLGAALQRSQSFRALAPQARDELLENVSALQRALGTAPADPYALALDFLPGFNRGLRGPGGRPAEAPAAGEPPAPAPAPRAAATETLAARAGALADEINFPSFVAGLVHGTFDAVVDASIRQMEEFSNLVAAVAKDVDDFTQENVTANQARDWLAQQHPGDLHLDLPRQHEDREPVLRAPSSSNGDEPPSPAWLADYGLEGEPLTDELIEEQLVPAARKRVGGSRLQTLATMVLLGMNRVVVRDGKVSARVRFRAAATDKAHVDYATSNDPGGGGTGWGTRGSSTYVDHQTMVSTVGVNAQADTDLKVELFGEVEINFVSETLPLDRFADAAKLALVQRNSRARQTALPAPAPVATPALPPVATQPAAPAPAPAPVASAPAPAPAPAPAGGAA